jgi:hypothetical protein
VDIVRLTNGIVFALILAAVPPFGGAAAGPFFTPPKGFVPDARTATAIARAVLSAVYGADMIRHEEPLVARDMGKSWYVNGTLQCAPQCVGGTAFVEIARGDGHIVNMFHTK